MNDSSRIFWRLDRGLEAEVLKEGEEEEDNFGREDLKKKFDRHMTVLKEC
jgi:hypothetical protein